MNIKTCEVCSKQHDGSYGSGRFCSSFCARKFSTIYNRKETSEKARKTIKDKIRSGEIVLRKNPLVQRICPICKRAI